MLKRPNSMNCGTFVCLEQDRPSILRSSATLIYLYSANALMNILSLAECPFPTSLSLPVTFSNFASISPGARVLPGHREGSSHWAESILGLWLHPLWAESGPEDLLGWQDGGAF